MHKNRLEAFSDGVLAIIITIMVLEIKVPHGEQLDVLIDLWPRFVSYILSFAMVLIYWNNHHHLFQSVKKVNGHVLLANGHLLFWLSLSPFFSGWMGENHFGSIPVIGFGVIMWMSGLAYFILTKTLIKAEGGDSVLAKATGNLKKEMVSLVAYTCAIAIGFYMPLISALIYLLVAVLWLIPDKRIEKVLN